LRYFKSIKKTFFHTNTRNQIAISNMITNKNSADTDIQIASWSELNLVHCSLTMISKQKN